MLLVKRMLSKFYKNINATFVIHSEFETIVGNDVVSAKGISGRGVLARLRESISYNGIYYALRSIAIILKEKFLSKLEKILMNYLFYMSGDAFHTKKSIEYRCDRRFKHIVYGRHAKEYANKFIDINKKYVYFIDLPIFMKSIVGVCDNKFVKFAVFGFGDMDIVHKIGKKIEEISPWNQYEIRNIGSCGVVANYIYCATMCGPHGRFMDRDKMDWCAEDIDMFVISNEMNRYRLSSSGSVLEAISHVKPIIHLDNNCSNYFNKPDLPIGIKCRDIEEMATKMVDIIENYEAYRGKLEEFRNNILVLRDRIRVENQLQDIRAAFTFDDSEEGASHQ